MGVSMWQLLCLTIERFWLALGGPFLLCFAQTGLENAPLTIAGMVVRIQSGRCLIIS